MTYEYPGSESNYWHGKSADIFGNLQLRKGTELEERGNRELLHCHNIGRLTSRTTAQGAGTASKVVLVTEHVIGFAS